MWDKVRYFYLHFTDENNQGLESVNALPKVTQLGAVLGLILSSDVHDIYNATEYILSLMGKCTGFL